MSDLGVAEIPVDEEERPLPPPAPPAKNALVDGPILRTLLWLAWPNVIALTAGTCVVIAETSYIGRLGELVDFTASLAKLDNAEADKIPPLLAISSGRLARGLMRVRPPAGGTVRTVDAVATPLWDGSTLVGSLTFFSEV